MQVSEAYIAQHLDAQGFVPYIGKPSEMEEARQSFRARQREAAERRAELARKSIEAQTRRELERARKKQISDAQPDIMTILAAVAHAHGVPLSVLLSKNKNDRVARTRHHAVWQLHTRKPSLTQSQLAMILKRDRSSVQHGLAVFLRDRHVYEDRVKEVAKLLNEVK